MRKTINRQIRKRKSFVTALLTVSLSALLVSVLLACGNIAGGTDPVDKRALGSKIQDAEDIRTGVRHYADDAGAPSTLPANFSWVTDTEWGAFETIIGDAKVVNTDTSATQPKVNNAFNLLDTAINDFFEALKPGPAQELDLASFDKKLSDAKNSITQVTVVPDGTTDLSKIPAGSLWVYKSELEELNAIIAEAETAMGSAETQGAFDDAKNNLTTAIKKFEDARDAHDKGTQTTGYTVEQLDALIGRAEDLVNGVKIAPAGSGDDIGPLDNWAETGSDTLLKGAITAAKLAKETETGIDLAYTGLNTQFDNFSNNNIKQGTPTDTEKKALIEAIGAANVAKDEVKQATKASEAPYGSFWATPGEFAGLNNAIFAADNIRRNSNATKTAVDNMVGNLTNEVTGAITVFKSAVRRNGEGTQGAPGKVTVTGLGAYNSLGIREFRLVSGADDIASNNTIAYGDSAVIIEGVFSTPLYTEVEEKKAPWSASGSHYISFLLVSDDPEHPLGYDYYISSKTHNFGTNSPASLAFTAFRKAAYFITPGAIAPYEGTKTLDELIEYMSKGAVKDYAAFKDIMPGAGLYKKEALTNEFKGGDALSSDTVMWAKEPYWAMMPGGDSDPTDLPVLKGALTLTDLPSDVRNITVRVSAYDDGENNGFDSDSARYTTSTVTSGQPFNWEIPISEYNVRGDIFNGDLNSSFYVTVTLTSGRSYDIRLPRGPETLNLSSGDIENIALGSASAGYAALSGKLNVRYNNMPVPALELRVLNGDGSELVNVEYLRPVTDQAYTILVSTNGAEGEAVIIVEGYDNLGEHLFAVDVPLGALTTKTIDINFGNLRPGFLTVLNAPAVTYYAGAFQGTSPLNANNWTQSSAEGVPTSDWVTEPGLEYRVAIQSGNSIGYTASPLWFVGGTAVVDWKAMTKVTSVFRVNNMVNGIDNVYVFQETPVFANAGELDTAIADRENVAYSRYNGEAQYIVLKDTNEEDWKGTGSFQVVLMSSSGDSDDPAFPRYYTGTLTFDNGVCITDMSNFNPLLSEDANNVVVTVTINGKQDISFVGYNPASPPVVTSNFTAELSFPSQYSNFMWFMDAGGEYGVPIPGAESSTYTFNVNTLSRGQHWLTLLAHKGGEPYSAEIYFVVEK